MIALDLASVADVLGGDLAHEGDAGRVVERVVFDSRQARAGDLFVPLEGERVDGHDFVAAAVSAGASGYLWPAARPLPAGGGPGEGRPEAPGAVLVDDPLDAFVGLGAWLRDDVDPTVVAVTGSLGKTTTKDLTAAALSPGVGDDAVVASLRSYNNELGLADTLCRLDRGSRVLVAEVGSRGPGHIATVVPVLRPDIAVVTTVAGSHLEMFGDLDGVAAAKAELVEGVDPAGFAVLNADDPRVLAMASRCDGTVVTYGLEGGGAPRRPDVLGYVVDVDEVGRHVVEVDAIRVLVPVPGRHNASNALAAIAVARVLGHDPVAAAGGLAAARVSPWRSEVRHGQGGVTVLNDAYNASPESMAAAFEVLAQLPGRRRIAVLGRMAEMGASELAGHRRVGREAVTIGGVELLVVVGDARGIVEGAAAQGLTARHVPDPRAAAALVLQQAREGDVVLVKASRSSGLEVVAQALLGEGSA